MYSVWCEYIGIDKHLNGTANTSGWIEDNGTPIVFNTLVEATKECEENRKYNWLRHVFIFEVREYK